MTPEEFVLGFYEEKSHLIKEALSPDSKSDIAKLVASLNLSNSQQETMSKILHAALRDFAYTILLGIDGEAQIGGRQEAYKLFDEANNELTGGEIEIFAWEYFHNK